MATLTAEALLAASFGIEDVEIPGKGTVKVRALTRSEALALQGVELNAAEMERRLVSTAMVEPKLTEDQVQTWQDNSPAGELEPVAEVIIRLSGMEQKAGKQAYADFRE